MPTTVFSGKPYVELWQPPIVEMIGDSDAMQTGDFFLMYSAVACTLKAKNIVNQLITDQVEFLPVKCNEEYLFILNVIDVIDCLDYQSSEMEYFSSGNLRTIRKYMFKPECVLNKHIFKNQKGV